MIPLAPSFGWIGMILLVAAYALVTAKKADPKDVRILALNILGSAGIGISAYTQRAWPAVALQVVWAGIALVGLVRRRRPLD